MVEVQTQVRVASGVKAIVVKAADRVELLESECTILKIQLVRYPAKDKQREIRKHNFKPK